MTPPSSNGSSDDGYPQRRGGNGPAGLPDNLNIPAHLADNADQILGDFLEGTTTDDILAPPPSAPRHMPAALERQPDGTLAVNEELSAALDDASAASASSIDPSSAASIALPRVASGENVGFRVVEARHFNATN